MFNCETHLVLHLFYSSTPSLRLFSFDNSAVEVQVSFSLRHRCSFSVVPLYAVAVLPLVSGSAVVLVFVVLDAVVALVGVFVVLPLVSGSAVVLAGVAALDEVVLGAAVLGEAGRLAAAVLEFVFDSVLALAGVVLLAAEE